MEICSQDVSADCTPYLWNYQRITGNAKNYSVVRNFIYELLEWLKFFSHSQLQVLKFRFVRAAGPGVLILGLPIKEAL